MDELRKGYHQELQATREELARAAAMVTEAIPRATAILLESDLEGADALIRADALVDERCVDVEERCIRMLALQAPVASELRQIIAILKMTAEVERSGDLAASLCKVSRRVYGHPLNPKLRGLITSMGEQAQALWVAAIEAFIENDAAKAAAVIDMDAHLDALQKQFIQTIFEVHAHSAVDLQVAIQMAYVARFYERIGDHAVNVAERVRFVVTGWVPDHKKPERGAAGDRESTGDGTTAVDDQ